jgi:hypothetical protein
MTVRWKEIFRDMHFGFGGVSLLSFRGSSPEEAPYLVIWPLNFSDHLERLLGCEPLEFKDYNAKTLLLSQHEMLAVEGIFLLGLARARGPLPVNADSIL